MESLLSFAVTEGRRRWSKERRASGARSGMWEEGWAPRPEELKALIHSLHLRKGWVPPSPQDPPLSHPLPTSWGHIPVELLACLGPLLPPHRLGLPCSFQACLLDHTVSFPSWARAL